MCMGVVIVMTKMEVKIRGVMEESKVMVVKIREDTEGSGAMLVKEGMEDMRSDLRLDMKGLSWDKRLDMSLDMRLDKGQDLRLDTEVMKLNKEAMEHSDQLKAQQLYLSLTMSSLIMVSIKFFPLKF